MHGFKMICDQGCGTGQHVSDFQVKVCRFLHTCLPRLFQGIQHIFMPEDGFVELHAGKALALHNWQNIVLIEAALRTASDQTGMKNQ